MSDLKTLKEIGYGTHWTDIKYRDDDDPAVLTSVLREEAKKWLVDEEVLEEWHIVDWVKHFFNMEEVNNE